MKKILAAAVAIIMVTALCVNVFAADLDLSDGNLSWATGLSTGVSDELVGVKLAEPVSVGQTVTVHAVGSSNGDFRVWLGNTLGQDTMSPEPLFKASENGFTSGNFDLTFTLECQDKDGTGTTTADCIIFKGPSWGVNLDSLVLTSLSVEVGGTAAATATTSTEKKEEVKTVAAAGDATYTAEFDPAAGYTQMFSTASDSALVNALEAIGDDAVLTVEVSSDTDVASYSYLQLMLRDSGWADDNIILVDFKNDNTNTFSISYADLKSTVTGTYSNWDISKMMFISNCADTDTPVHVKFTVSGAAEAAPEVTPAETTSDETTPAETTPVETAPAETKPAETKPAENKAPATGLTLAVVPAVIALAAVAVSKRR